MKKFVVRDFRDESYFARQQLISWWDQEIISRARVLVVGAGALGNETIKNLILLGFRNLTICDFDTIETSNLSRTILFGPRDLGQPKADVAAERARKICLVEEHDIRSFHGDITSEFGFGNFHDVDIVLGCVDNVEARRFVNRACRLVGRPWIDSGINDLAGHVSLYLPASPVCYECVLSDHQLRHSNQRYSCDRVKRLHVQQARVPTVQVTSSIISGIQVQECVKHLCGHNAVDSVRLWFDGNINEFEVFRLRPRSECIMHASFGAIQSVPVSSRAPLGDALAYFSARFGPGVTIDTQGIRQFVRRAHCRKCNEVIDVARPLGSLTEADLVCARSHDTLNAESVEEGMSTWMEILTVYDSETEPEIMRLSLRQLGIPPDDIITVRSDAGGIQSIRLIG